MVALAEDDVYEDEIVKTVFITTMMVVMIII
jgi:hypothetical protein